MKSDHVARDLALTALTPAVWGSTYLVTTELLPPDRPLLAAAVRALPAGLVLLAIASVHAIAANVGRPSAVQRSRWNGFERLDFTVGGRACILVVPATAAPTKPWI